jgi:DNA-binding PadR family transcriptional regulator
MRPGAVKRKTRQRPRLRATAAKSGTAAPSDAERLTPADLVVMAALAERPTHGYDLVNLLVRRDAGGQASVSKAQVYYSLKKLLRRELIAAAKDSGPPAGPERERYRLTAAGRRAMATALSQPQWARERPPIPFHTWLQLVAQADPVDRAAVLRERRAFLDQQIASETARLAELRKEPGREDAVRIAVVSHALEVCRLERELLAAVEPMLR